MRRFWIREAELQVGSLSFTLDHFDFTFRVPFSTYNEPDVSEIIIYNLSDNTIATIEAEAQVILNAGYQGNVGNILSGELESVSTKWQGVDKLTTLTVSDRGADWRTIKLQKAYHAGVDASYIMEDIGQLLGLEIMEIAPTDNVVYQLGKSISGVAAVALQQVVKDSNSKMYINKGQLFIRPEDSGTPSEAFLDSEYGLIGSPEKVELLDKKTQAVTAYNVKSLLNHQLSPDGVVKIESKTLSGSYRIKSGVHLGGTESEYYTELVVVPM